MDEPGADPAEPLPTPLVRPLIEDARWASTRLAQPLLSDSQAFYARWSAQHTSAPYAIYHYTDAIGLQGIVESGQLFASDLLYLNQSREIEYAWGVLREQIRSRWTASDPLQREFCERAERELDPLGGSRSVFVACFSEDGDALGQWRAHTGREGGYAIGFRTQALPSGGGPLLPVLLRRVNYAPEQQRSIAGTLLDRAIVVLKRAQIEDESARDQSIATVLDFLADHAVELLACFKQPTYRDDTEWRLVLAADTAHPGQALAQLAFSSADGHPVPHVRLDISGRAAPGAGPIAEVICGPAGRPQLAMRTVQLLLRKHGVANARVRPSALTLGSARTS